MILLRLGWIWHSLPQTLQVLPASLSVRAKSESNPVHEIVDSHLPALPCSPPPSSPLLALPCTSPSPTLHPCPAWSAATSSFPHYVLSVCFASFVFRLALNTTQCALLCLLFIFCLSPSLNSLLFTRLGIFVCFAYYCVPSAVWDTQKVPPFVE